MKIKNITYLILTLSIFTGCGGTSNDSGANIAVSPVPSELISKLDSSCGDEELPQPSHFQAQVNGQLIDYDEVFVDEDEGGVLEGEAAFTAASAGIRNELGSITGGRSLDGKFYWAVRKRVLAPTEDQARKALRKISIQVGDASQPFVVKNTSPSNSFIGERYHACLVMLFSDGPIGGINSGDQNFILLETHDDFEE